jgi:hypothetical protein
MSALPNAQVIAILQAAQTQIEAVSAAQQASIDSDNADITSAQAQLAADQADVATQTASKQATDNAAAQVATLIASLSGS